MKAGTILKSTLVMALLMPLIMLTACSSGVKIPDEYKYDDLSEFIKLGEYKGIEYEKADDQVSESEIRDYIDEAVAESAEEKHNTTGVVGPDSAINIDYTGSIDGVEFDGGSAQDVDFFINDNNYIDGFAESIIGHNVGETFDINVRFPDNYGNEELSGKDAVFTITVNYIIEDIIPEYNEQWVKDNTEYSTVEEYEAAVKADILEGKQNSSGGDERLAVFNKIVDSSEVIKYPETEYNTKYDNVVKMYKSYAEESDMEFDEYLQDEWGMTEDEFNDVVRKNVESNIKNELVLYSIAGLEGIEITNDEYNEYIQGLLEDAGYTEDSFKEERGTTIQQYAINNDLFSPYLYQRVMDKVMEYSVEK